MLKIVLIPIFSILVTQSVVAAESVRGIDFRMQFISGKLDFTSISGIPRKFNGIGSELQTSLYLLETNYFRTAMMISSRVMTWVGQGVLDEEYDDIQTFSVAPGLELQLGPLYLQATSQRMNANAYYISSASKGKPFIIEGSSVSGGLNFKFGNLGLGLGVRKMNFSVPGSRMDLSTPSQYIEESYSLNLIYYIGLPPGRFFRNLFLK